MAQNIERSYGHCGEMIINTDKIYIIGGRGILGFFSANLAYIMKGLNLLGGMLKVYKNWSQSRVPY